jgi:nucleotidyltransferase substrate binding protein (TIGR01987 family)
MTDIDIRWKQRFSNFQKAMKLLGEALALEDPSDLEIEGMIQRFEYTFELAWKTLKDYLEEKGYADLVGSRDSIRLAFANGIIDEGETWMEMISDRNLSSHLYEQQIAQRIATDIRERYHPCFIRLLNYLEHKAQ